VQLYFSLNLGFACTTTLPKRLLERETSFSDGSSSSRIFEKLAVSNGAKINLQFFCASYAASIKRLKMIEVVNKLSKGGIIGGEKRRL